MEAAKDHDDYFRPMWERVTFTVIEIIVFVLSIMLNSIIIVILRRPSLKDKPDRLYVMNMMIGNIVFALVLGPIQISFLIWDKLAIGGFLCKVHALGKGYMSITVVFSTATLSLGRYFIVTRPLEGGLSKKKTLALLFFTWAIPMLYVIIMALNEQFIIADYEMGCCVTDYKHKNILYETAVGYVGVFIVCAFCIIYCNVKLVLIGRNTRRKISDLKPMSGSKVSSRLSNPKSSIDSESKLTLSKLRSLQEELKYSTTTLYIVLGYLVCFVPFGISVFSIQIFKLTDIPRLQFFGIFCLLLAPFLNPVAYYVKHRYFRDELRQQLKSTFKRSPMI